MKSVQISQPDFQIDYMGYSPSGFITNTEAPTVFMYNFSECVTVLVFFLLCPFIKQSITAFFLGGKKNPKPPKRKTKVL